MYPNRECIYNNELPNHVGLKVIARDKEQLLWLHRRGDRLIASAVQVET